MPERAFQQAPKADFRLLADHNPRAVMLLVSTMGRVTRITRVVRFRPLRFDGQADVGSLHQYAVCLSSSTSNLADG